MAMTAVDQLSQNLCLGVHARYARVDARQSIEWRLKRIPARFEGSADQDNSVAQPLM
jgi:hypothetical protein